VRVFNVPLTVQLRVEVESEIDDVDVNRASAEIVGQFLAGKIKDTLIPKPGVIIVTDVEVGYPEEYGGA